MTFLCPDAVQRRHNLPSARPAVAAVPLASYAIMASKVNALHLAKQLPLTLQPPLASPPAGVAAADAHPGRAAAVRRVAGELTAAYTQDVIPLFTSQFYAQHGIQDGSAAHAVRVSRALVLALWVAGCARSVLRQALRAGPQLSS